VSDAQLKSLVHGALAARDEVLAPPAFERSWRGAVAASEARRARVWLAWLEPAVAVAGIAAIALAAAWHYRDPGSTPLREAAELQLARELAPARQWPVATDALLRNYKYGPPSDIVIPQVENPFEESFL
jgi:hypothetical protein